MRSNGFSLLSFVQIRKREKDNKQKKRNIEIIEQTPASELWYQMHKR